MSNDAKIDLEKVCSFLSPSLLVTISASLFILSQNVIEINRHPLPVRQLAVRTRLWASRFLARDREPMFPHQKNDNKDQIAVHAVTVNFTGTANASGSIKR